MIKKLKLKYFALAALLSVFVFFLYVAWVVTTIPMDMERDYFSGNTAEVTEQAGIIEAGSYVEKERFEHFFNFLKNKNFNSWLRESSENGMVEEDHGRLFFHQTFQLPSIIKNHCTMIYCYQNKVPFRDIPSVFWKGLIGVEDNRFVSHSGVDPKSILRAIVTDIKKMKLEQGGSTLTQQLIKNLYLSNDKKFVRKLKEIILSIYFENKYSKEDILEIYFNEIEWGSLQGIKIKGIHAAVLMYFNKKMDEIDPYEAAIIISMLKGPYYYSPLRHAKRLRTRADVVFKKLQDLDMFSKSDSSWGNKEWEKWTRNLEALNEGFSYRSFWRAGKENFKKDYYERYSFIYSSKKLIDGISKRTGKKDIAVKYYGGEIGKDGYQGGYYSKFERSKEAALKEEFHQIGSTIKPILYNFYREEGILKEDLVETAPVSLNLKSGKWSPRESHKDLEDKVPVYQALLNSLNRPTVRLANSMGFELLESRLLGYIPKIKTPLSEYPAQLLGAVELSVEELFHVYQRFFVENCLNSEKENWIIEVLSDPNNTTIRKVVSNELKLIKFFGKTGTTNNGYDNWFVGFDGNELMIIWVGFEGIKDTEDLRIYGSSSAFVLYQDFMTNRGKRPGDMMCQYSQASL